MNLNELNDMQKKAVLKTEGPVLILAGAGSGKTRVITYRIAYLIEKGVHGSRILALTFTNKAAKEMRNRIDDLIGGANHVLVATFHSFCVRVLRQHIEHLGYKKHFTIYDDDDSKSIIKQCIKELEFDEYDNFDVKIVKGKISSLKNDNISVQSFMADSKGNFYNEDIAKVYELYEQKLKSNQALDFNDLLSKTLYLLKNHPDVLEYYRDRFMYIHVDEYQDTNTTQYELVKLLTSGHRNLCVVGDDDQSIYGWRGANIRNILDFEKDFSDALVIRLEQNYRSTNVILDAANSVICNNIERKEKKLWTTRTDGEKIQYFRAENEKDEAFFVTSEILRRMREEDRNYRDFAVLYRTNSQSRVIEEYLLKSGIPYKVFGGFKFYSRKEIKDVIAYLAVCINADDDVAMRRIINTPKRGIGDSTVDKLMKYAALNRMSLYDAMCESENTDLKSGAKKKIQDLTERLNILVAESTFTPVGEFVEKVIMDMGLISQYEEKITDENISKKENLLELIAVAKDFGDAGAEIELADFLENVALVSDMDDSDESDDKVSLMTMHSAKGLEFPVVFMVGMENGLFPSQMSREESRMEEERRLCYVGMTRAKEVLYMTNAFSRYRYGQLESSMPSIFMSEIPKDLMDKGSRWVDEQKDDGFSLPKSQPASRSVSSVYTPPRRPDNSGVEFVVGQKVNHTKFGDGTVVKVDGKGSNALVSVAFDGLGIKKLSTAFAPLKPI